MQEEFLESKIIENSIDLLRDFFNVIADGYNPSLIYIEIDLTQCQIESEILKKYHYGKISKTEISSIQKRIEENFYWCLDHLVIFSQVPELFKSKFHYDNMKQLIKKIEKQLYAFIKNWNSIAVEYLHDTNDGSLRRILVIYGDNKTIIFHFGNYIH